MIVSNSICASIQTYTIAAVEMPHYNQMKQLLSHF